jgi:hypothetical protein
MFESDADSGALNMEHLQNSSINIVETFCSIVAMPVEMIIRPRYGTRYFPVPVTFCSGVMMLLLPPILSLWAGFMRMFPASHYSPAEGLFDFVAMSRLYFLLCAVHGFRLWGRMLHMEREQHSQYEGPPLPFFSLLPKSQSFWFLRIIIEPCFVFLLATVLEDLFIVDGGLGGYLHCAALALACKNFVSWFRSWQFLRKILDMRSAAPAMVRLVENKATPEDLATMHLASFPKDLDPQIRRAAAVHIAHALSPEINNSQFAQET